MPQAVDEAGNIWEVDAQGNPVRLLRQAQQQQRPMTIGTPDPYKTPKDAAGLQGTQLNNTGQAIKNDIDSATRDAQIRKANAEAAAAEADAQIKDYVLKHGGLTPEQVAARDKERNDRVRSLAPLIGQINRVQSLYEAGPGATKGPFSFWQDYLPSDANSRFDTAGAQLSQMGLGAFRIPGQGTVSDRDAVMFDRGNMPTADTRDASIEEILGGMRRRVEQEYQALGVPSPQWQYGPPQEQKKQDPFAPAAVMGGAANPPAQPMGGNGPVGGDGPVIGPSTGDTYVTPEDMARRNALFELYKGGADIKTIFGKMQELGIPATPEVMSQWQAAIESRDKGGRLGDVVPQESGRRNVISSALGLGNIANSPFGAAGIAAADAGTFGLLDEAIGGVNAGLGKDYKTERDFADLGKRMAMDANPNAAMAGTVAGGLMGGMALEQGAARMLPRVLSPQRLAQVQKLLGGVGGAVADGALYGTAYGAGSNNNDRLSGGAKGAVAGGLGGTAGYGVTKGIGRALSGVSDEAVKALAARGVTMSPGQIMANSGLFGKAVKKLEDASESIPVLGSVIRNARQNSFQDFNRAALNEAVAPVQATVSNVAENGVNEAFDAVNQGYGRALNGVRIRPDQAFARDVGDAVAQGRGAGGNYGADFNQILSGEIQPLVGGKTELSGQDLQDLLRISQGYARQYGDLASKGANGIPQPMARPLAGAFDNIAQSIEGLAQREAPGVMPGYNAAKGAYRNTKVIQEAVDAARNGTGSGEVGLFTPAQLSTAAARNARKFGGTHGTTNQPFYELTRAGQQVLPSSLPNSGTADRWMSAAAIDRWMSAAAMGVPAALAGAGAATGSIDPTTAAWVAGLSALYSKGGQKALQKILLDRPDAMRKAGSVISGKAKAAGLLGSVITTPLLTPPTN